MIYNKVRSRYNGIYAYGMYKYVLLLTHTLKSNCSRIKLYIPYTNRKG